MQTVLHLTECGLVKGMSKVIGKSEMSTMLLSAHFYVCAFGALPPTERTPYRHTS